MMPPMTSEDDFESPDAPGDMLVVDEEISAPVSPPATAVTWRDFDPDMAPVLPWWRRRGPVARFQRWAAAPWPVARIVRVATTAVVLVIATTSVLRVVHFPRLVLKNNTPTGGDMGAHVFAPAFLRDVLLPNFQLSGWSNYWYAGFPLYRFYMVVPALMIVALNLILPYGIAFKIVTILGLVTLPLCCWAFGRLARFVFPIPELMAIAALLFMYDESFYLLGGNVKSTMAGEFSFSIALSFAVLGLGVFARGLETGKYRSWAAILIALAMLCHGIVLLFVVGAAILMWLVWIDRTRLVYGAQVLGAAFLLSAFWVVPFVLNHKFMTDMKYGGRPEGAADSFWDMFFPWSPFADILVSGFALAGFAISVARRHVVGAWLGITCIALFAATYLARESLPVVGLLWNPRILPFLYLMRLMLMMVGIVEVVRLVVGYAQMRRELSEQATWISGVVTVGVVGVVSAVALLMSFREMPFAETIQHNGKSHYALGAFGLYPIQLSADAVDAKSDAWTSYNFTGYEGRDTYGEYKAVVDEMGALGKDPQHGCGRAVYENNGKIGGYGTTMALMLLPHWTNGCITSMEGVFFEASGTTPYHFLTAAAVSDDSSNPVRGLSYENTNLAKGAEYMRTLGVRYLMVFTKVAKDAAALEPGLTRVAAVGPWVIYEIPDTQLVVGLTNDPVVVNERDGDQRERYLEIGTSWFQHQDAWPAVPATEGPADWQRIDVQYDPDETAPANKTTVRRVFPVQDIEVRSLAPVQVTNIRLEDQAISFDVDRTGVPVMVKVSYFPNWEADGAQGPYRAGANQMIVIPQSNHVRLEFSRSTLDWFAYFLTALGIAALVWMRRNGDADLTPATAVSVEPPAEVDVIADDVADGWSWDAPESVRADPDGPDPGVVEHAPDSVGVP